MTMIGQLFGACCGRSGGESNPDAVSRVSVHAPHPGINAMGRSVQNTPPMTPSAFSHAVRRSAPTLIQEMVRISAEQREPAYTQFLGFQLSRPAFEEEPQSPQFSDEATSMSIDEPEPEPLSPLFVNLPRIRTSLKPALDESPALYEPGCSYSADQLIGFARPGRCESKHRMALASNLAERLNSPEHSHPLRFELSAALAHTLEEGQTVNYANAKRGDSFFASMAIDLYLSDCGLANLAFVKKKFIAVLSHWVNDIAPDRQEFSIQGASVKRSLIKIWIQELKNPSSKFSLRTEQEAIWSKQRLNIARSMDRVMRGQDGSRQQSVHSDGVVEAGNEVLNLMSQKLQGRELPSLEEVLSDVKWHSMERSDRQDIHLGIGHVCSHDAVSIGASSTNRLSPGLALRTLAGYIQHHDNPDVAANLRDASMLQLAEIGRERPCFSGCVQRMLDIPNGIDPAVSAIPVDQQIKQDVVELAARVQNEMSTLFDGTELEDMDALEGVDEAVLAQIKVDLFKQVANTELGFVRGIPQSQFMKEVDRMSPGFTR
ncbi:hypothetical protein EV673_1484 [Limnobacter thiooxidans]|nr:hypothetical protein EV673_1484 [Limnobacter thiooxidans]